MLLYNFLLIQNQQLLKFHKLTLDKILYFQFEEFLRLFHTFLMNQQNKI